jgi:hypothetical protein
VRGEWEASGNGDSPLRASQTPLDLTHSRKSHTYSPLLIMESYIALLAETKFESYFDKTKVLKNIVNKLSYKNETEYNAKLKFLL